MEEPWWPADLGEALDTVRAVLEEPETCERFRRVGEGICTGQSRWLRNGERRAQLS